MDGEHKTTTADTLLGMLTLCPMSGYDLKLQIEHSIGNFWAESFGQIYPALKRLEQDGLVQSLPQGKGNRTVYAITPAGREHVQAWLEIPPRPRTPRSELLLKLFFGALASPAALRSYLLQTRARSAADLLRYQAISDSLHSTHAANPGLPYWLATLNYGRAEARMILAWCDETLETLERDEAEQATALSTAAHLQPAF